MGEKNQLGELPVFVNDDGTFTLKGDDGGEQLLTNQEVVRRLMSGADATALQQRVQELTPQAEAMKGLNELIARNPQAGELVNKIIRLTSAGQPVTTEALGLSGGEGGEVDNGTVDPTVAHLRQRVAELEANEQARTAQTTQTSQRDRASALLSEYPFLVEANERGGNVLANAVDLAVAKTKPDVPLEVAVRQVAADQRALLNTLASEKAKNAADAQSARAVPSTGQAPVSTGQAPGDERRGAGSATNDAVGREDPAAALRSGEIANTVLEKTLDFLGKAATGG